MKEGVRMYKEARKVGYLGRLFGKNIGKADNVIRRASNMAANKKKTLEEATKMKGIKGKLGPIKFDFTKNVPKYSEKQIGNMMRHNDSRLARLKKLRDRQGDKTFKTRLKTVVGAGGAGALYGAKKRNDEYGIPKMSSFKRVVSGLRDAATFKGFRRASEDLRNLRGGKASINRRVNELNELRKNISKVEGRNNKLKKVLSKIEGTDPSRAERDLRDTLSRKFSSRVDNRDINQRVRAMKDAVRKNENIINNARNTYSAGMNEFTRIADNELGKSIGLYGAAGGVGYGAKKLTGRKRE